MQSLAALAGRILAWEQIDLPNQVYRVQNVRWIVEPPDFTEWIDCSDNAQWSDELDIALEIIGEVRAGLWIGMGKTVDGVCHGLAWLANSGLA